MRQLKITKSITSRESDSLNKYLEEIGKEELISVEEEVILAQRIKQGDILALEKLTKANLRFVVSVAKKYQNQGLSLPDLINEGNLGLMVAAERFDETRGFKFISYAVWWIRQSILKALVDTAKEIRLPLNQSGSLNKVKKMAAKLEQTFERTPTHEEIALALNLSVEKISDVYNNNRLIFDSFDEIPHDTQESLLDTFQDSHDHGKNKVSPDYPMEYTQSISKEISRVLSLMLNGNEIDVLMLYYGIGASHGLTLDEIAAKYDLTREKARQIKDKALRKLRNSERVTHLLKSYLG